jgi:orotidine-5'-phosphate decarboxylase
MMKAAKDAAMGSAEKAGVTAPLVIAITVLTSFTPDTLTSIGVTRAVLEQVDALSWLAQTAGLDGVVASPHEVRHLRKVRGEDFVLVTPGIRAIEPGGAGRPRDDQARTMSALDAIGAGASYIVVGRPIIAAPDPRAAAEALARTLSS